ncbi:hypothetical protein PHMEG_00021378 [Phytophthora megakarya]|uniref:Bzip transcription factor n=1 Tax=Phytophthora megakarya TaxID=4795 RepID=A0A225VLG2_9STRA|nr:hypothetical protein PHMEG_00021378 [Phytophthora megakarya]
MKCEIAKLKADIASLIERRNDSLQLNGSFQFLTSPRVWLIAAEYVHHFSSYILSTVEPVELLHQASKFLNTVMVSDVIIGSHFGIEAQLENWRLYAQFFDKIQLGLRSMHMSTTETLVACTCVSVTITNRTLQQGFPHLNSDGTGGTKGGVWSPVAVRMLDQKLIMCGTVKFGLDVMDKVTRVDFQADMMTPMTKLLHNLRTVSYAFTKARITPDFYIVRDVDI